MLCRPKQRLRPKLKNSLEDLLTSDPFLTFQRLLDEASAVGEKEPTAMTLSTLGLDGYPSSRTVLFKGLLRGGLSFYTNYISEKSRQLEANPRAIVSFFWPIEYRQLHVRGWVEKTTRAESEAYFQTRHPLSQLGAWASLQSETLDSEELLQKRLHDFEQKFKGQSIPCPENWGGYILRPVRFEFWFGRDGRLHDRYRLDKNAESWVGRRLYP